MKETYQSIGSSGTLPIAYIGVALIVWFVGAKLIGKSTSAPSTMLIMGLWDIVGGLTGMPVVMLFIGMFVIGLGGVFAKRDPKPTLAQKISTGGVILGCAAMITAMEADERITLTHDSITSSATGLSSSSKYRNGSLPRVGLRIDATRFTDQAYPRARPWYSWDIDRGDMPPRITVSGASYYWGPHGIITGDQLGKRICNWAGVKPVYDTYPRLTARN